MGYLNFRVLHIFLLIFFNVNLIIYKSRVKNNPLTVIFMKIIRKSFMKRLFNFLSGYLNKPQLCHFYKKDGTGSFASSAFKNSMIDELFSGFSIFIKSTIIIPDIFLRRSCLHISAAASRFILRKVSSRFFLFPSNFPVFTSITVSASVGSIIRYAPDLSHTCGLRASCIIFQGCNTYIMEEAYPRKGLLYPLAWEHRRLCFLTAQVHQTRCCRCS